jgi:hypothetical protein
MLPCFIAGRRWWRRCRRRPPRDRGRLRGLAGSAAAPAAQWLDATGFKAGARKLALLPDGAGAWARPSSSSTARARPSMPRPWRRAFRRAAGRFASRTRTGCSIRSSCTMAGPPPATASSATSSRARARWERRADGDARDADEAGRAREPARRGRLSRPRPHQHAGQRPGPGRARGRSPRGRRELRCQWSRRSVARRCSTPTIRPSTPSGGPVRGPHG